MLWALAIVFLLLWVLGLVTSTTLGGLIHVLVAVAVVLLLVRIIKGGAGRTAGARTIAGKRNNGTRRS